MYEGLDNIFTGILKMNPFKDTNAKVDIDYRFDDNYSVYLEKYNIKAVAGNGSDFEKAKNLLFWLCEHCRHYGEYYDEANTIDSVGWLEYSYDNGEKCGINCAMLAQILTECLLAIGIKARRIGLNPYSPYDNDCHYVTEVYCRETGSFVMLDPTYCLYVENKEGKLLSVKDIREYLSEQNELFFNEEANYNGTKIKHKDIETYYAKNYAFLYVSDKQGRNTTNWNNYPALVIAPETIDFKIHESATIYYRVRIFGEEDWLKERASNFENSIKSIKLFQINAIY